MSPRDADEEIDANRLGQKRATPTVSVRHISVEADVVVEIEWIERNGAGQVIGRYIERVTRPPRATREARREGEPQ